MAQRRASIAESPTEAFFQDLARQQSVPLVRQASGTLRFDVVDGDRVTHQHVTLQSGRVKVSHARTRADAVVRLDAETFDGMVRGKVNAMAAMLRGDLVAEGDLGLLMLFQRLFPSPPAGEPRRAKAARAA